MKLLLKNFDKNRERENNSSTYNFDFIIVQSNVCHVIISFEKNKRKEKQQQQHYSLIQMVCIDIACDVATEPIVTVIYSFVLKNLLASIQSDVRPTNDLLNILLVIIFMFGFFHFELHFSQCPLSRSLSL